VAQIIAAGIIPAGLEMMDKPMTAAVEDFVHAGYDLDAEAILLCESTARPRRSEEIAACSACCAAAAPRASGSQQRRGRAAAFWAGRKARSPRSGRISARLLCMDGTIPRKRLAEMLIAIAGDGKEVRLRC
jgi:glycolate oxidase